MKVKSHKKKELKKVTISVRLTDSNMKMLASLCQEYGVSRQHILNQILDKCFSSNDLTIEI